MAFDMNLGSAIYSKSFAAQEFGFSLGRDVLVGAPTG